MKAKWKRRLTLLAAVLALAALFAVGASAAPAERAPPGAALRETLAALAEMDAFDAGVAVREMLQGNYISKEDPPAPEEEPSQEPEASPQPAAPEPTPAPPPQAEQAAIQLAQPKTAASAPAPALAAAPEPASVSPSPQSNLEALAEMDAFDAGATVRQKYCESRNAFFDAFVFLSFMYAPEEGYFYTVKEPFQTAFGFNELYDRFAFVANCYVDTVRCKFRYDDRDWMVQLWKGGYGIILCTGGEVGIYNKPTDREIEHYDCAKQDDWIGMEMTIYKEGVRLFTRTLEDCWWLTGFAWGTLPGFYQAPRVQCVMDSTLTFPNAEMASLFAEQLAEKGFAQSGSVSTGTPDSFVLAGDTVQLIWQQITESAY